MVADGVELLQVKTLGPSQVDASYDQTRRLYSRMGFRPLEEIHDLWPGNPCLIMVKVLSARPAANPKVRDFPPGTGIPPWDIQGLEGRFAQRVDQPIPR